MAMLSPHNKAFHYGNINFSNFPTLRQRHHAPQTKQEKRGYKMKTFLIIYNIIAGILLALTSAFCVVVCGIIALTFNSDAPSPLGFFFLATLPSILLCLSYFANASALRKKNKDTKKTFYIIYNIIIGSLLTFVLTSHFHTVSHFGSYSSHHTHSIYDLLATGAFIFFFCFLSFANAFTFYKLNKKIKTLQT